LNKQQKVLLLTFLVITVLVIFLDNLFPGAAAVSHFKFFVILTLFLIAFISEKKYPEQVTLTIAVFFLVMGDFFANFCSTLPEFNKVVVFGVLGFLWAYLLLTEVFKKKLRIGPGQLIAASPVLAVYIPSLLSIYPYIDRSILPGVMLFSFVLCYMAWVSTCTIFNGYYRSAVSLRMALTGFLIFISDIAVGNSLFNPAYADHFIPWLKNIIWGTYIPAWTLVVVNIVEDNLH